MSQRKVYVVERKVRGYANKWIPIITTLSAKMTRERLKFRKELSPLSEHRVVKYIPEPPKATKKGKKNA